MTDAPISLGALPNQERMRGMQGRIRIASSYLGRISQKRQQPDSRWRGQACAKACLPSSTLNHALLKFNNKHVALGSRVFCSQDSLVGSREPEDIPQQDLASSVALAWLRTQLW